jgi:O-acetyl-ADP-ribose deacetylase (regulator of RNase III)
MFPKRLAAETAVRAVREWVAADQRALESVSFVCFGSDNLRFYEALLRN